MLFSFRVFRVFRGLGFSSHFRLTLRAQITGLTAAVLTHDPGSASVAGLAFAAEDPEPCIFQRGSMPHHLFRRVKMMRDASACIGLTRHIKHRLRQQRQLLLRKLYGFYAGVQAAHKQYFATQIVSDPGDEGLIRQQG